ncbi:7708_t:CDS:2 [Ambispora leptoticha]|uniref:ATP synthase subunit d, mitochondrial n=1 Tax=Ambispora leptoticha TaxID=144679 RepID=A0A9N9FJN1_9GLOM|nr:7708_t:CDS:2 [Ambispora leptoticha]
MATTRAVAAIDWSKLTVSLGLTRETVGALIAFRKRNEEAKRIVSSLREQPTQIDFEEYRSKLKNKSVVNEAEKAFNGFKPTKVDLNSQLRIIEKFEAKAVERAEKTVSKFDSELRELQHTLANIESARPLEELTIDEVAKINPEIDRIVDKMVKRGYWDVPGYEEKFGS